MLAPFLTSPCSFDAYAYAKHRLAVRYAAMSHGSSGYERSLRSCDARFRVCPDAHAYCSEGDR